MTDISPPIEEISFEPLQMPLEDQNENMQMPNLDSIQNIPEPEIPVAPAFMAEEMPGPIEPSETIEMSNEKVPLDQSFTSEDDIISIEGNELDRLIYSGFTTEEMASRPTDIGDIPIIEESKIEEEIPAAMEQPVKEENFIPPIDLQREEMPPVKEEPAETDFNFDLSAIPDVSEVEEDEPIALSLDELNKIDISEENVVDYETPTAPEVPVVQESFPPIEEENVEISLDELNRIEEGMPEAEKISPGAYMFESDENKEIKEQVIESKIDVLSDSSKEELRKVLGYLDNLLENLPEDKIKEFAKSEYYDLYVKILSKLGI